VKGGSEEARGSCNAVRLLCTAADAGDGLEDANFERETADSAVLRLTAELEYATEVAAAEAKGALRTGAYEVRPEMHTPKA
jgi:hypothetical protein